MVKTVKIQYKKKYVCVHLRGRGRDVDGGTAGRRVYRHQEEVGRKKEREKREGERKGEER